jgi:hypothetical protein
MCLDRLTCPFLPASVLPSLKGQGLPPWRFEFEAEPSRGEEPVDERGLIRDVLGPVLDDGSQVIDGAAARLPRPLFVSALTPSTRFRPLA